MPTHPCPLICVVGPTAVGKSDLAVRLALRLDAEIVNADAYQLYRGMDIGTAKLTPAEQQGVPHHLLDVLDVDQDASVADYQRMARAAVDEITGRGRPAILVGGSGLYLRAAIDRLEIPGTDARIRARLEREAGELGGEALYLRLTEQDPRAAAAIEPRNTRRVIRALEVIELTGRTFSATMPVPEYQRPTVQIGLTAARSDLDARIARRTRRMFEDGLVDEVRGLLPAGLDRSRTACRAVGYAQVLRHLAGQLDLHETIEATEQATRRLVRRQQSWFGRDCRIGWLHEPGVEGALELLGVPVA